MDRVFNFDNILHVVYVACLFDKSCLLRKRSFIETITCTNINGWTLKGNNVLYSFHQMGKCAEKIIRDR